MQSVSLTRFHSYSHPFATAHLDVIGNPIGWSLAVMDTHGKRTYSSGMDNVDSGSLSSCMIGTPAA